MPGSLDVVVLKIKAVLFDLGSTLIKTWTPEITYQNILSSVGIDRSTEAIKKALEMVEKEFTESNLRSGYGKVSCTKYWKRWDSKVLKHLGIPENQISAKEILARWWDHAECVAYPDTKGSLNRLKQIGVKVGLVSNAYEEDIDAILKKAGLEKRLFDIMVGVNTIKKAKPQPDIFRYALDELDVEPKDTLFIGDHVDNDYKGARAVGIHALLIERDDRSKDEPSNLERVRSLQEIFKFIE
jgi:2-haloalkanoic acid dehalogenase type II